MADRIKTPLTPAKLITYVFAMVILVILIGQLYSSYAAKSISPLKVTPFIFVVAVFLIFLAINRILSGEAVDWKKDGIFMIIAITMTILVFLFFAGLLPAPLKPAITQIQSMIGFP